MLRRCFRALVVGFPLTACAPSPEGIQYTPVSWSALPGWETGDQAAALGALRRSCNTLLGRDPANRPQPAGLRPDWQGGCEALARTPRQDAAVRRTLRRHFRPYRLAANGKARGRITGYYEISLKGSRERTPRFDVPLYGVPDDHVTADLGRFDSELDGRRVVGRVEDGRLLPYPPRSRIAESGVPAPVLAWAADPVEAFFLHVQGSGRIHLRNGETRYLGYAADNGRPYVSIGQTLIDRGAIAPEALSLPTLRRWLNRHPEARRDVLNSNPRYIFFETRGRKGAVGAQGVRLTPGRSLAVDRAAVPLGMPVWLMTRRPLAPDTPLRRLVVAQDAGAAIKGGVRGDLFWGHGETAEKRAGRMKAPGRFIVLIPRPRGQDGRDP